MHIDKHKLMPPVDKLMPMCVSYGISLCLCEIRIYLYGLFTFAKIPDNNIYFCYKPQKVFREMPKFQFFPLKKYLVTSQNEVYQQKRTVSEFRHGWK